MKEKSISSVGEFAFLDIVRKNFAGSKKRRNIAVGIGDDCFCFKAGKETVCITKDMLIEDVHFKKAWISPVNLGRKAVEINISDIASMGGVEPKYIFIGLGLPADIRLDYVKELYKGFKKACDKYGVIIAGGDTVKSDKIVISITVVGTGTGRIVKRSGAENGDFIGVTNTFGDSGAGVSFLYKYGMKHKFSKDERQLIFKHNNPEARLKEARKISKYATSMTDASDGIFISVGLLAKESKKGADIFQERIPVSQQLKRAVPDKRKRMDFALCGAEDFELVFTVQQSKAGIVKKLLPQVSYIGQINNSKKVRYFYNGKEQKTVYGGYKHF